MKILYIITRSDVMGGASVHLLDLAVGMKEKGHNVRILVGGTGIFNERACKMGLEVFSLSHLVREISPLQDFRGYFEIRRSIKKYTPDLVHLHSSKVGILGRIAAHSLKIPCVFTAHGWAFTEGVSYKKRWLYRLVEQFMAHYVNKIIAVSEYDRQLALANRVGNKNLITTVHNGVPDYSRASEKCRVNHGITNLVMVARFDAPKNQVFLIETLKELKASSFIMNFVGDGPQLDTTKRLVDSYGLKDKVIFLGARNDVPDLLSQSDVFLLISNWEGLPLTILEAMSHSLPVIASDVGGISETIVDGEQGYLIPRGDKEKLTHVLEQLIQSNEARLQIGTKARQKYENEFTVERMIDATESIYFKVVSQK